MRNFFISSSSSFLLTSSSSSSSSPFTCLTTHTSHSLASGASHWLQRDMSLRLSLKRFNTGALLPLICHALTWSSPSSKICLLCTYSSPRSRRGRVPHLQFTISEKKLWKVEVIKWPRDGYPKVLRKWEARGQSIKVGWGEYPRKCPGDMLLMKGLDLMPCHRA